MYGNNWHTTNYETLIDWYILVAEEKPQRRASVCSLDSGTSLSFLSSNGTRSSDNKMKKSLGYVKNMHPMASARSTEV